MLYQKEDNLTWLQFENLTECKKLEHRTYLHLDLNPLAKENIQRIQTTFPNLHYTQQIHGKKLSHVTPKTPPIPSDSLTTNHTNLALLINHADCQAAIFYDPINHALSNVHAGWRGSTLNIYAETIQHMIHNYGTKPQDLLIGISPSLGPNSAEFINYKTELPKDFWGFQTKPNYFNFWEISRFQLEQCGVLPHHIEIASIDTFSNQDQYFSYRRGNQTERHGTIAMLK